MKNGIFLIIIGMVLVLIGAGLKITGNLETLYNIVFILGFILETIGVVIIINKYKK
ncbi:hypothetical protein FIA58_011690 [Flavobacterium jejuense]|uniref:Gliding motility protein GldL n=1 Tax=Flavobacterium jejuense TaxID=1544455 RepID=A0ABX0IRC0_9FLAO|nr:hypothetical protein [Flavobacterium jejuense]NHN26342.1 hypothetical protein [Flavobacterium jejuense]